MTCSATAFHADAGGGGLREFGRPDHPELPGRRDADPGDSVAAGEPTGDAVGVAGRHQRRYRTAHLQPPPGGHRRLHLLR